MKRESLLCRFTRVSVGLVVVGVVRPFYCRVRPAFTELHAHAYTHYSVRQPAPDKPTHLSTSASRDGHLSSHISLGHTASFGLQIQSKYDSSLDVTLSFTRTRAIVRRAPLGHLATSPNCATR